LSWRQTTAITADSLGTEPSKPSKPSSEGFEGSISSDSPIVGPAGEAPTNPTEVALDWAPLQERVMSWAEWKAAALNRLFEEHGRLGRPGRITAETVLHGQRVSQMIEQCDRRGTRP
jgi:hypothetical protein